MWNGFLGQRIILRDWTTEDVDQFTYWQRPDHKLQELDGPYFCTERDQRQADGELEVVVRARKTEVNREVAESEQVD